LDAEIGKECDSLQLLIWMVFAGHRELLAGNRREQACSATERQLKKRKKETELRKGGKQSGEKKPGPGPGGLGTG
jgi:hypothetical protein